MPRANRRIKRSVQSGTQGRRVVLYIRYSSRMQEEGWSLEAQQRLLEAYCAERGWVVVAIFYDEAKSAKDDNRPGFQQMMAFVRAGNVDRILVHKLDRFSRNLRNLLTYVEELDRHNVGLVCAAQPIDTSDPMTGKLVLVILGALAEMYLVTLSEETIKGKRERAEQGLWLGMLPWAYDRPEDGDTHQAPVLDTQKAALWQAAADLYDPCPPRPRPDGLPEARAWGDVAEWLNTQGARMVTRWQGKARWSGRNPDGAMLADTVADMLQNLFYAGYIVYDDPDTGEQLLFAGKHEPITDRAQIERIQVKSRRRLSLHTQPRATSRVYAANGIVRCAACGHPLNVATSPGGARYTCLAGRHGASCPARCHSIKVADLDRLIGALIARLRLPKAWRATVAAAMNRDEEATKRKRRRADLQARLARVHERYEADGFVSSTVYRLRVAELQAEIDSLGEVATAEVLRAGEIVESLAGLWALPNGLPETGAETDDADRRARRNEHMAERRAFLQMAFATLVVDLDRKAITVAELRPAYQPLAELLPPGLMPQGLVASADSSPVSMSTVE